MPPLDAVIPSIAIGLLLVVMLWFALGTGLNIRKGNDLLRWLQGGLPLLGRRTTLRWLGSSAVELGIVEPVEPFREATVLVVLEPRDVAVLWAWAQARGRRDFVIVRANLVRAPRFSLDVRDPGGWTGGSAADGGTRPGDGPRRRIDWPGPVVASADAGADDAGAREAWERLSTVTGGVWRMTIQPVVPHLEVHLRPPATDVVDAGTVLRPIRELAVSLSRR